jgi:hypothetical protein
MADEVFDCEIPDVADYEIQQEYMFLKTNRMMKGYLGSSHRYTSKLMTDAFTVALGVVCIMISQLRVPPAC